MNHHKIKLATWEDSSTPFDSARNDMSGVVLVSSARVIFGAFPTISLVGAFFNQGVLRTSVYALRFYGFAYRFLNVLRFPAASSVRATPCQLPQWGSFCHQSLRFHQSPSSSDKGPSSGMSPLRAAHSSLVIRMARGLEPWKGPTMPFSSISSTIRAARA